jgi:hypothetical protein
MFRVLRGIRCSNPPAERARARTPGTWRAAMRRPPNRVGDLVAIAGRHSNPSHQDRARRDSPLLCRQGAAHAIFELQLDNSFSAQEA